MTEERIIEHIEKRFPVFYHNGVFYLASKTGIYSETNYRTITMTSLILRFVLTYFNTELAFEVNMISKEQWDKKTPTENSRGTPKT